HHAVAWCWSSRAPTVYTYLLLVTCIVSSERRRFSLCAHITSSEHSVLTSLETLFFMCSVFFFQAEDGIRDWSVTGVQTCALPISDVPAGRAHRNVTAIDAVPKGQARALAQCIELPSHIVIAPSVLEKPWGLSARNTRFADHWLGSSDCRERDRAHRGEASVSVVWRPLAQLRWVCQRMPDLRRRMAQLPDENERPGISILANLSTRGLARLVVFTPAHRCFPFRRGFSFMRS